MSIGTHAGHRRPIRFLPISSWGFGAGAVLLALTIVGCGDDQGPPGQSGGNAGLGGSVGSGGKGGTAGKAGTGSSGRGAAGSANAGTGGDSTGGFAGDVGEAGTVAAGGRGFGGTSGDHPTGGSDAVGGTKSVGGGTTGAGGTNDAGGTGSNLGGEGGEAGDLGVAGAAGEAGAGGSDASVGAGGSSGATCGGTSGAGGSATAGTSGTSGVGGSATAGIGGTLGASGSSGSAGDAGTGGVAGSNGGVSGSNGGDACAGVVCSGHGVCSVATGSAVCSCDTGFVSGADTTTCVDVDECAANHGGCDSLTTCTNSTGSYACGACPAGYDGTGASGCVPHACSGAPDASCACIHVALDGDDTLGAASGGVAPFASVQAAVDFAGAHREHATNVCLAEGTACGASAAYTGPTDSELTMRNGVSVFGNYESSGWTRCSFEGTTLLPQTIAGLVFDASVQSTTALDGVTVRRFFAPTTTGITITGARGVVIHDVQMLGGNGATDLHGIQISSGAQVSIDRFYLPNYDDSAGQVLSIASGQNTGIVAVDSQINVVNSSVAANVNQNGTGIGIWLANGSGSSITGTNVFLQPLLSDQPSFTGIHVENTGSSIALDGDSVRVAAHDFSAASITGIELIDAGRASLASTTINTEKATTSVALRAIRSPVTLSGSITMDVGLTQSTAYGVWLEDAPGSTVTSNIAIRYVSVADGIHVVGSASGDVFAGPVAINQPFFVPSVNGSSITGISLSDCLDAPARITSSVSVAGGGEQAAPRQARGIQVGGDCPADIASAVTVTAGSFRSSQTLTGIGCAGGCDIHDSSVTIQGNQEAAPNLPPSVDVHPVHSWTGVGCGSGCARIVGSTIKGLSGIDYRRFARFSGTAVAAGATPLISRNVVYGNCGGPSSSALSASNSRIENNIIEGPTCGMSMPVYVQLVATGSVRTDVYAVNVSGGELHSNLIDGGRVCDTPSGSPSAPNPLPTVCFGTGVLGTASAIRNNIVRADTALRTSLSAVVDHNDLVAPAIEDTGTPSAPAPVSTIAAFEALDSSATGNFSLDPRVDATGHLQADSPCIDAGTKLGAPSVDIDGDPRDASPDVGADEWTGTPSACFGVACPNRSVCLAGGCQCDPGYTGQDCATPNPCATNNGGCDPLTTCTAAPGGRTCGACPPGYAGDGASGCVCPSGYSIQNGTCISNDCATNNGGCDPLVTCTDTSTGHTCGACPSGFTGDGASGCVDVDECLTNNGGCPPSSVCENEPGSFTCACPAGYDGTPESGCIPGCAIGNGGCDPLTLCTDTPNGPTCGACPAGYYGNGTTGCSTTCPCEHGGTCTTNDNGYACACAPTFTGDHCQIAFTSIAAGESHACGLRSDGTIVCWGFSQFGDAIAPSGTFTAVSTGLYHSCAIRASDGGVECWGQTGTAPAGSFTAIASTRFGDCAIGVDKTLSCWVTGGSMGPAPTGTFKQIAGTLNEFCALGTDDHITCFGDLSGPHAAPPTATALAVSAGLYGSCAILSDGTLDCWDGSIAVPPGTFKSVSMGFSGACAIAADDTIDCFADDGSLNLVPAGAFKSVSVGLKQACAIRSDDSVICWGSDTAAFGNPPY